MRRVRERLNASGYTESELIGLLREVRLMTPKQATLEAASQKALSATLEEWDNVTRRLDQKRAKPPENPDRSEV